MTYKFEETLKEVIVECGDDISIDQINENVDLVRDLNYNSINLIQLVIGLENAFNIEIDDDNLLLEKLSPYKKLVEILKSKLDEDYL